jgi:hypothetical protein
MLELLEDPAYQHILLNHLPITGLAVAWLVLVSGAVLRQRALLFVGLTLVTLTAGASIFVGQAGEDAYAAVFDALDGDGRAWLDYHSHLGDTWLPVLYVNAALASLAIGAAVWRKAWLLPAALAVVATTLAGLGAAVFIAESGGKIKHPEFRLTDPPEYDAPGRLR